MQCRATCTLRGIFLFVSFLVFPYALLHLTLAGITELVKRTRSVKVHSYIIHYLRKQMPIAGWGKKEKQEKLMRTLERQFNECAARYNLALGDFPPVQYFRKVGVLYYVCGGV